MLSNEAELDLATVEFRWQASRLVGGRPVVWYSLAKLSFAWFGNSKRVSWLQRGNARTITPLHEIEQEV